MLTWLCCLLALTGITQEIKDIRDVLKANLEATGGMENWRKVKVLETKGMVLVSPGESRQEFRVVRKAPGYVYEFTKSEDPRMQMETVMRGTPEKLVQTIKRNAMEDTKDMTRFESYLTVSQELNMLEDKEYKLGQLESETLKNGTECWVFEVTYGTSKTKKRYYDKKTFLLAAFTGNSNLGDILHNVEEHKKEAGLLFPVRTKFTLGGVNATVVRTVETIAVNPEADDNLFFISN